MSHVAPRVVTVRAGVVRPTGSWVYVWIDTSDGSIVYVGATGFDPELRAFLHLTSDDPEVGRVRSRVSRVEDRDFDVLCFTLPSDCSRADTKRALRARLAGPGGPEAPHADEVPTPSVLEPIIEPIVAALREHIRHVTGTE